MMRREALMQRADAIAMDLRVKAGMIQDKQERAGVLQAIEAGALLLDILIDIAHPERQQDMRR